MCALKNDGKGGKKVKAGKSGRAKYERLRGGRMFEKEAQQRSEREWACAFDAIADWVIVMDIKGRVLRSNRAGETFTGLRNEEMIGQSCCRLVHGSKKHIPGCPFLKMLETGRRESAELQVPGEDRWLMVTVDPVTDEEGELAGVVHVVRDITERRQAEEVLAKERNFLDALINSIPDHIYCKDRQSRFVRGNEATARDFGLSDAKNLVGKSDFDFFVPELAQQLREEEERVMRTGKPLVNKEEKGVLRGIKRIWTLNTKTPWRDSAGSIIGVVGVNRDITERRQAQEALRASEGRFRGIVQNIGDLVWDVDERCVFTYCSEGTERLFGYPAEEVIGKTPFDFMTPAEAERVKAIIGRLFERKEPIRNFENYYVHTDGTVHCIITNGVPVLDDAGNVTGYRGVCKDVTERKQVEQVLAETEARYRAVVENIPAVSWKSDEQGGTVFISPNIEEAYGYTPQEIYEDGNKLWFGRIHPEDRKKVEHAYKSLFTGKAEFNVEYRIQRKDGSWIWLHDKAGNVREENGVLFAYGAFLDITERKRAEEELAREHDLLRTVIDNIPDRIYVKDAESRFVLCNKAVAGHERLSSADELVGKTDFDFYPPQLAESYFAEEQNLMQTATPLVNREGTVRNSADGQRCVLTTKVPLRDSEGKVTGIVGINRDITERKRAEEALRESEEKYRSFVEHFQGIAYRGQMDFTPLFFHGSAEEITGYKESDFLAGRPRWDEVVYPEDRAGIFTEDEKKLHTVARYAYDREYRIVRRDGQLRWVHEYIQSVPDSGGNSVMVQGTIRDITERKRAEDALAQKMREFKSFVDNIPHMSWLKDLDSNFILANQKFGHVVGMDPEYLRSHTCAVCFGQEAAEKFKHDDRIVIEGKKKITLEEKIVDKDGKEIFLETTKSPVFNNAGDVIGTVGIGVDITDRKRAEAALKQTEYEEATILDNMAELVVYQDEQHRIVRVNRAAAESADSAPEQLQGRYCYEVWHQRSDPCEGCPLEKALKTGGEQTGEVVSPDGRIWLIRGSPVRDADGKTLGAVEVVQNITERKKAEEALYDSRNMLQTVLDLIPAAVFWKDRDSVYLGGNRAFLLTAGLDPSEQVVGKTDYDLPWDRDQAEAFRRDDKRVIESGVPEYNIIESYRRADGAVAWAKTNKVPLRDTRGNVVGVLGTYEDITERKQTEEELASERNLLRTLIDNIPDEIYAKDKESRFILANKAVARRRRAASAQELIGKTDFDLYPQERARCFYEEEQHIIRTGQALREERRDDVDEKGDEMVGLTTKMPLRDSSGQIVGILGIGRNVTEQEQATEKLLKYQGRLKTLASQLSLAEERERRRIAGELHDQVSQSLALAKIKLDALRAGATAREPLDVLTEVSATLAEAIGQTRSLTFDLSYPILYELGFEAAVAEWLDEHVRKKHGLETVFENDGQPKPLDDSARVLFFRSIRELLINVVKHACADKVVVSIRRVDGFVEVQIEDDGVGFDRGQLDVMAVHRGGFGIFSIRERLEELGGGFEIDSAPGEGCRVIIRTPLNLGQEIEGGQK